MAAETAEAVKYGTEFRNDIPTGLDVVEKHSGAVEGINIVLTGTSEGSIGAEAAKALAAKGKPAKMFLLARTESKVAPVLKAIKDANSSVEAVFVQLDLMDLDSVRKAANAVLAQTSQIHILMNFAGIFIRPEYVQSKHDVEQHFATNHLGHFLLTNLLMPAMIATWPHARIVQLSSGGHIICPLRLEKMNFDNGETYHPWEAYSHADSACILFARELARRLKAKGFKTAAFSANPGFVPDSNLNNHLPPDHMKGAFEKYLEFHESVPGDVDEGVLSLEQGPATPLIAALDSVLAGWEGAYVSDGVAVADKDMREKWVVDDELAKRLWELDEELVGEKFL
ncbi:hypothetical protein M409DRAFT_64250 [Zasmidium cellare ATCC 36951]|uniref:Uncharacterized protein n=1 Tax=Zasmidium cellare ATCC 36951 TaxID=1080233 RepID=A0A6A6CTS5_ZASCE|nr:uncharacterized protein M409DRAFT_64250 [Zasmidium cellare ATCC 36951]KAF2170554.1 hypothetical protein M409DRAFT_64250 [Zasmidium cellare ATCC 36951]